VRETRREKPPSKKAILAALAVTTGALVLFAAAGDRPFWPFVGWDLLKPIARVLFLVGLGLVGAKVVECWGVTQRLGSLAGPVFAFAGLGERFSAAFATAFFSGVAANAMLLDWYEEGRLTKAQLYLSNFINQLPAYCMHLPTTFFIIVPLTGMAGVIYLGLTLAAALLRTGCCLVFAVLLVGPKQNPEQEVNAQAPHSPRSEKGLLSVIRATVPVRFSRVVVFVVSTYTVIAVIHAMGGFAALREEVVRMVTVSFLPVEAVSVVIVSFMAEFSSGFAAAGALLDAGAVSTKEAVLALLVGNVVAFPVRTLRHQLPRYMGIYSPRLGASILFLGQMLRIASLALVGAVYGLLA